MLHSRGVGSCKAPHGASGSSWWLGGGCCRRASSACLKRRSAWGPKQARASAQQGTLVPRELHRQAYNDALVARYQHLPDIRRIQRHRRLPAPLYKVMLRPRLCQDWRAAAFRDLP